MYLAPHTDLNPWWQLAQRYCFWQDMADQNPELRENCTTNMFRPHLSGTTCDLWNTSATCVFTDNFLAKNADIYPKNWTIHYMVLKKTWAYIKTLVKNFCNAPKNKEVKKEMRLMKGRYGRKIYASTQKLLLIST